MDAIRIRGGKTLHGVIPVSGAKNAALKMMAAAALTGERCRLTNVPEIEDVRVLTEVLTDLGVATVAVPLLYVVALLVCARVAWRLAVRRFPVPVETPSVAAGDAA